MKKTFKIQLAFLFVIAFCSISTSQLNAQTVEADYLRPGFRGSTYDFTRFGTSSLYFAGIMHNKTSVSYGNGNDVSLFTYGNRDLTFRTGSGNFIVFPDNGTGKIGVGTTSPAEKLDVRGSIITNSSLKMKGEYGRIAKLYVSDSYTGTDYLVLSADNSTSHMKIGTNGNVAIGSTVTTAELASNKLSVDGTVKAEEVIVENVGADFVFEDGYNLRSLEEVENFINENNHLPDVAPASETTQGIKVSEFNTMLLQKIEELTLYIIEQDKRIAELESK